MKITIEDIKKEYISRFEGSSFADQPEEVDTTKLAHTLRHMSETSSEDDLALIYLDMIKEARSRASKRLGLEDGLSLR